MQAGGRPSRIPVCIKVEDGAPLAAGLEIPRRRTSHAGTPSRAPVHTKVEEVEVAAPLAANPEKLRRYPSFSAFQEKWSQSPLRVPTPLAEEFYRSTIVKRESDEVLGSEDGIPPLCHDCDRSAGLHTKKPSAEAPHDSLSPSPRSVANVKTEVGRSQPVSTIKTEAEPSPGYYITPGSYKTETTAPSASSNIQHQVPPTTYQSRLHHEARIPGRSTATTAPTHRPETELSYRLPVTPTPFSTPNAPVNPYDRPTHLHCIPGSLLEGMQRRTRWGNRNVRDTKDDKERRTRQVQQDKRAKQDRQAKQTARVPVPVPVLVPHPLSAPPLENVAENEHDEAEPVHGKTCAWYKIPFCKCCACIMVAGTKLLRNMFIPSLVTVPRPRRTTPMISTRKGWTRKRKCWHLQKCSKQRDVEGMVDQESHAAR